MPVVPAAPPRGGGTRMAISPPLLLPLLALLPAPPLAVALDNGLGRTPALGWSSWNFYGEAIDEKTVLDTADALISTGLAALGFEYVNIDAGSMQKNRTREGKIQEDRTKFPRGIRYVSDQLHAKGLKLGVSFCFQGSPQSCALAPR